MANAQTEIDLDDLHQAIIDKVRAAFPQLRTVADYPDDRKKFVAPACFIELTELEGGEGDPGTGQVALLARFEARIIIGFRTPQAKREIRKLCAALAAFTHLNRWGLPVAPAEVIGCYSDDFDPVLDQYEVWRLEWSQTVHIGQSVWTDDGTPPAEIYLSYAPDIGGDHVGDYQPLEQGEDKP